MRFLSIVSLVLAAAASVFASPAVERDSTTPSSLAVVLNQFQNDVQPHVDALNGLTSETATQDTVQFHVDAISTAVNNAISGATALQGQPQSVILAPLEGDTPLTADDVGNLLGDILKLLFTVFGVVLNLLDDVVYDVIFPLLCAIGKLLCELVSIVCGLVAGVAGVLLLLLVTVLGVLDLLGITSLLNGILGGVL